MSIYQVTLNGKTYTVEIPSLQERPIRAIVDGEVVEVDIVAPVASFASPTSAPAPRKTSTPTNGPVNADRSGTVYAPLPGTVVEISVTEGDHVQVGQQLCVLEAMKMNNAIRATHAGTIKQIMISLGQQVQHNAALMEID